MSTSPTPSSPANFMSSLAPSTVASSPPPSEDHNSEVDTRQSSQVPSTIEDDQFKARFARLERLLEKSFTYSNLLGAQMDKEKRTSALRAAMHAAETPTTRKRPTRRAPKRRVAEEPEEEAALDKPLKVEPTSITQESTDTASTRPQFLQPALITGGKLKDYQLEGVEWLVSLDKNGVSGILADEMGLGKVSPISFCRSKVDGVSKTLQVIAFNAHLREIPVCMYHGPPAERAELRRTAMREPDDGSEAVAVPGERIMAPRGRSPQGKAKTNGKTKTSATQTRKSSRIKRRKVDSDEDSTSEEDEDEDNHKRLPAARYIHSPSSKTALPRQTKETFPVVVTTYEIIIRDQPHLSKYNWGYIVVDEGHRLKNLNCRLIQEIKKYPSAGRMILTGTPLHNNLAELWSLLNFILPDIFDDLDTFQEWYSRLSQTQSTHLISTLHGILKPFLLRRLKADVEGLLPPKKEYVIYAPLSVRQRDFGEGCGGRECTKEIERGKRRRYDVDESDEEYFERIEKGEDGEVKKHDVSEVGKEYRMRETVKGINNMRLQNTVMQLRKACSHPLLFRDPTEPIPETTEELVDTSGKMMLLERLLHELFRTKHKVLLFSQFTTILDIIETWATEVKGWNICRIDGSTGPLERREHMNLFQGAGERKDAPMLFLLSTRAGGLGITLTAADTVIFYDQDWNPQMDIQAQDRAHRIGQTKPVLVFRLVTAHTIETRIMQRATEKRKLEALVIAKGKFKMPGQAGRTKADNIADMAAALLKLEGDDIEVVQGKEGVLSDRDLGMLLDRSEAVFTDRGKGWSAKENMGGKKAAFAVYEAPVHSGNELVAKLMGEDIPE
ncbi:P-loop containing nucleoside triphosphate hydrolase protein [Chiua virens]|nr:P-loop containing nucleoside triphosphate hydrolase protein [Chiua virens]